MVVSITTITAPSGCRTAITHGHKIVTIDGDFDPHGQHLKTGQFSTSYMFGT